jgi:hypothetical protein
VGVDLNRAAGVTPEVDQTVDDMFEYHTWDERHVAHGKEVREALVRAVKAIIDHVPPGPDRSVAIRKLREARNDCNSAITHGGKY